MSTVNLCCGSPLSRSARRSLARRWLATGSMVGALAPMMALPGVARGSNRFYVGTDASSWNTTASWSTTNGGGSGASIPVNGDNAYAISAAVKTITFNGNYAAPGLNILEIECSGVSTFTLNQGANNMVAAYEYVGFSGHGAYSQSGGTNTVSVGSLYVAYQAGSIGAYSLTGTGILTAPGEYICDENSTGSFTQGGTSTNTVTTLTIAGVSPLGHGTYTLNGGLLSAGSEVVGAAGLGTFTQSGGTNTLSGSLTLATSGTGIYNLNGGTATVAGSLIVNASGNMSIAGGTLRANGDITVTSGTVTYSTGSFNWAASKTLTVQSGGRVLLPSYYTTPTNAIINVTGAGSQLSQANSGDLAVTDAAQLNITLGGSFTSPGSFDVGHFGAGTVVVDGPGSSFTSTYADSYLGESSGVGTMTFRNGASGYIGSLNVGENGGYGTLTVQADAALTVGDIVLATDNGSGSTGTISLSGGSITQLANASLTVGAASQSTAQLTITGGTFTTGAGALLINPTGVVTIDGGALIANGGIVSNGGTLNFISGALTQVGKLSVGSSGPLVGDLNLLPNRALTVTGITTIDPFHTLTLAGGTLNTGTLLNNGAFTFTSGTLGITGPAGLTIGSGGALGSTLIASSGQTYNIANLTSVAPTGTLVIADGAFNALGGIANSGEIKLTGAAPHLTGGPITNVKLLRGDGRIDNTFSNTATGELRAESGKTLLIAGASGPNAGRINLQAGTVEFVQPLTNAASGIITGTGFLYADAGLTNLGQIQFSAGFTSVYGPVTNNGKVTVTGGGTATFYNNLSMPSGGTFQTSTNSTAVFFGAVSGPGAFTGPGTKDFEAGNPGPSQIPSLATITGTTIVGYGATLQLDSFNEAAISVQGALLLSPGHHVSRTASLTLTPPGLLDLSDGFLILDDPSALPTLRTYLASARDAGAWDAAGLQSSAAHAANLVAGYELTAIAAIPNLDGAGGPLYTTFDGAPVAAADILLRYTYTGDTDLNGRVDGADLANLLTGLSTHLIGWQNGDLNYDGVINAADLSLLLASLRGQGAPLGDPASDGPGGGVPEPALALGLLWVTPLTRRRSPLPLR